ncbi:phosphoglycerate dehydrogenase-like enzyme [Novosphingobium chloroacetimidivorans]|uniref:Phosphoglycerate dehydrogenase-like enzyme n=1 Tax=Novosphingobium chloroacetimidivorans TaxID=1428314 RepID=A0A7W7NUY9_9SPHN|nr:NAD(P)-dependent oxidoreductase [Novosphingobium chloroacetimidivorans]MBB4857661.1 phosphoglycerate dehydrogenase-like enzyme [Novosphingobium chloroacetimidivorans]
MSAGELVTIIDPIHPAGVEALLASGHALIQGSSWREDPRLDQTSVILIRTSPLGEDIFGSMKNLKAIVKHGAGVDNIAIPAASAMGVQVANTPGGNNSTAVAEGAVTMMLALLRQVREMDALVREDRWSERWDIRLGDLTGARVGLIGFGRIARYVARICGPGFGAEVAAYDPMVPDEEVRAAGVEPMPLTEILKRDVISIHTPLTEGTRNLIGAAELAQMHAKAIIVNCSRGGIIDEAALVAALAARSIGGAGIDVFEDEPPAADHPLFDLPNALLSPHVAGVTEAGMKHMALHCAAVIDMIHRGETPPTLLNGDALR